jgi:hypothetical protein
MQHHADAVAAWALAALAETVASTERRAAASFFSTMLKVRFARGMYGCLTGPVGMQRLLSLRSFNSVHALVGALQSALSGGDMSDMTGVKAALVVCAVLLER